jgi:hypothetical protein
MLHKNLFELGGKCADHLLSEAKKLASSSGAHMTSTGWLRAEDERWISQGPSLNT